MKKIINVILLLIISTTSVAADKPILKERRHTKRKYERTVTCMAKNIYFEAGNQTITGKIAVANVTLHRVNDKHYPRTVCGVVYSKGPRACAFSWTCDGKSDRVPNNRTYRISKMLARLALKGQLSDVTYNADHYHAVYVKPRWARKMFITTKIGLHIFYNSAKRRIKPKNKKKYNLNKY